MNTKKALFNGPWLLDFAIGLAGEFKLQKNCSQAHLKIMLQAS